MGASIAYYLEQHYFLYGYCRGPCSNLLWGFYDRTFNCPIIIKAKKPPKVNGYFIKIIDYMWKVAVRRLWWCIIYAPSAMYSHASKDNKKII